MVDGIGLKHCLKLLFIAVIISTSKCFENGCPGACKELCRNISKPTKTAQQALLANYVWLSSDKKRTITRANSTVRLFCHHLESALRQSGLEHRLVGWNSKIVFRGYKEKVLEAYHLAKSLHPDTVLIMVDAFDVLIQSPIDVDHIAHVLRTKYPRRVLFAGEGKCYPLHRKRYARGIACRDYPKSPLGEYSRYLNGGSWVGFARDVSDVMELFLDQISSWNESIYRPADFRRVVSKLPPIIDAAGQDQYGMAVMYVYARDQRVAVDVSSDVFVCDSGFIDTRFRGKWQRLVFDDDKHALRDTLTNRYPPIIHYNAGKNKFANVVLRMPWNRQRECFSDVGERLLNVSSSDQSTISSIAFHQICSKHWGSYTKYRI